jgi:restriction endonuclease
VTLVAIRGSFVDFEIVRIASRVNDELRDRVTVHHEKAIVSTVIDAPELRHAVVKEIDVQQELVRLSTGETIYLEGSIEFFQRGVVQTKSPLDGQQQVEVRYPIIDFPARVGRELQLSRAMTRQLFESIPLAQRERFLTNPEGFTNTFIEVMRDVLRAHVVERIQFVVHEDLIRTLEEVLPEQMTAKQRELVETPNYALYPATQVDSEEEKSFVRQLEEDDEVILYFKFPLKYKIDFPEIIGNYNPDWAVIRRGPRDTPEVYLVRETKGTDDLEKLRFAHEKHVIRTAYRCFREMGIDYRVVRGTNKQWYQPDADAGIQSYAQSLLQR